MEIDIDKVTQAERKLANLCEHCSVTRDTEDEEHAGDCPIYLNWEAWAQQYNENREEEERWREYEQEMWDDDRGDWKC